MMSRFPKSETSCISDAVLKSIEERTKQNSGKISDQDLLILYKTYGEVFTRSLEVLERNKNLTSYCLSDNLRTLVEVQGEAGRCYRLYPSINYCPCLAFNFQVLQSRTQLTCKHVLAVWIASITGKLSTQIVTRQQYVVLVQSMFDTEDNKP